MRKQKIYLETTLFNYYYDEDRGFAHDSTVALFKEIAAGKYEAYTSRFVIDELNNAPDAKRDKMLSLILEYDIPILETNDEAVRIQNRWLAYSHHNGERFGHDNQHELSAYSQTQNENRNRKHKRFERLPRRGNLCTNGGC